MQERQTQQELLESVRQLNRDAVGAFFRLYAPPVYVCLLQVSGDEILAKELTKDVFVQAVFSVSSLGTDASVEAWLAGILWQRGQGKAFSGETDWSSQRIASVITEQTGSYVPYAIRKDLAERFSQASGIAIEDCFTESQAAAVPVFQDIVWQEEEPDPPQLDLSAAPTPVSAWSDTAPDPKPDVPQQEAIPAVPHQEAVAAVADSVPVSAKPAVKSGAKTGIYILALVIFAVRTVSLFAFFDFFRDYPLTSLLKGETPFGTISATFGKSPSDVSLDSDLVLDRLPNVDSSLPT